MSQALATTSSMAAPPNTAAVVPPDDPQNTPEAVKQEQPAPAEAAAATTTTKDLPPAPVTPAKKKITAADIQLVQNLIERCLQLYMSQKEVVAALSKQAQVESAFTDLVWQKLEEQNPEFFRSYYTRLKLKDQIVMFNHVLEQQVAMVQRLQRTYWVPAAPSNGGGMMGAPHFAVPQPMYVQPPPPLDAGDGVQLDLGGGGLDAMFMGGGEEPSGAIPVASPVASLSPVSPEYSLGGIGSLAGPTTSGHAHSSAAAPGGGVSGGGLEMPLELTLPKNFSFSDLQLEGELQQHELMGGGGGGGGGGMHRDFSLGNLLDMDTTTGGGGGGGKQ